MKFFLKLLSALAIIVAFTACANGKMLQQEPPAAVGKAYYTTWTGGVKGAGSGLNLFIPVEEEMEFELDSVYFKGRKAALVKEPGQKGLYVARFVTSREREDRDIVMHSDPKKEYGNPAPEILEKIPFELEEGEAVVVYQVDQEKKYFRISGIKRDDSSEVKMEKPTNIQH